jgi:hypothetical protein
MEPESRIESFNTALILAGTLAITLASSTVLLIYGYMDHTQSVISLRLGNHDSRCIHQECWDLARPR